MHWKALIKYISFSTIQLSGGALCANKLVTMVENVCPRYLGESRWLESRVFHRQSQLSSWERWTLPGLKSFWCKPCKFWNLMASQVTDSFIAYCVWLIDCKQYHVESRPPDVVSRFSGKRTDWIQPVLNHTISDFSHGRSFNKCRASPFKLKRSVRSSLHIFKSWNSSDMGGALQPATGTRHSYKIFSRSLIYNGQCHTTISTYT